MVLPIHDSDGCTLLVLATGDGEKIMQFCPSFHIVQLMESGRSPQQACEDVVKKMKEGSERWFEVGVIALNRKVCLPSPSKI